MFGKISFLSKIKGSKKLRNIADQLYLEDMSVKLIEDPAIYFFELLNAPSNTLQQIRKQKYNAMVAGNC